MRAVQKEVAGSIWPVGRRLLTPVLEDEAVTPLMP